MVSSADKLAKILQTPLLIVSDADHIGSVAETGRQALHMAFGNR